MMKRQGVHPQSYNDDTDTNYVAKGLHSQPSSKKIVLSILDVKEANQLSKRLVSQPHAVVVGGRFLMEKLVALIDVVQIYALMWQLSQPWPWPARWLRWTRWTNAWNVDLLSFLSTGAAMGSTIQPFSLWGEMRYYWIYALTWALIPFCILIMHKIAVRHWRSQPRYDGHFLVRDMWFQTIAIHLLQVLYLPIGLAVMRLYNCDANGRVSVDPSILGLCWSSSHVLAFGFITCLLGATFLVYFPVLLFQKITQFITQSDVLAHERFVQGKELEYILQTSHSYLALNVSLYASFKRHAVLMPVEMCINKLALLVVFSLLRSPAPQKDREGLQGTFFFVILFIIAWRRTLNPAYRSKSTNRLVQWMHWLLVANGLFVLLCANGVRSAMTVATSVVSSLSFLNIMFLLPIAITVYKSVQQWRQRWVLTIQDNQLHAPNACWPTHELMSDIIKHGPLLERWMSVLKCAKAVILKTLVTSGLRPHGELASALEELQICLSEATTHHHLLMNQLSETLVQVNDLYVEALATSPFRFDAPDNALFGEFADKLQRRREVQRLVPNDHRRVLTKLKVVKTWSKSNEVPIDEATENPNASTSAAQDIMKEMMLLTDPTTSLNKVLDSI